MPKWVKSFTCRIQANPGKERYIHDRLNGIARVSKFAFDLGEKSWRDFNALYAKCRKEFPEVHSKHLQQFIRGYKPSGKKALPKDHPLPPALFLDNQNFTITRSDKTVYTGWWLRFGRKEFPLRGKRILERMDAYGAPSSVRIFRKKGKLWCTVSVSVKRPVLPLGDLENSTGLDLNASCMVTSDNKFYSTKKMLHVKQEHRSNKMSGRSLANFTRNYVHTLTKTIVSDLVFQGRDVLVLEDLKGLRRSSSRKNGTSKGKKVNAIINTLPFAMIRDFLVEKCSDAGIRVIIVSPHYTSKTCSACGSMTTKRPKRGDFVCRDCGLSLHADLNAARNIRARYIRLYGQPVIPAPVDGLVPQCVTNSTEAPGFSRGE